METDVVNFCDGVFALIFQRQGDILVCVGDKRALAGIGSALQQHVAVVLVLRDLGGRDQLPLLVDKLHRLRALQGELKGAVDQLGAVDIHLVPGASGVVAPYRCAETGEPWLIKIEIVGLAGDFVFKSLVQILAVGHLVVLIVVCVLQVGLVAAGAFVAGPVDPNAGIDVAARKVTIARPEPLKGIVVSEVGGVVLDLPMVIDPAGIAVAVAGPPIQGVRQQISIVRVVRGHAAGAVLGAHQGGGAVLLLGPGRGQGKAGSPRLDGDGGLADLPDHAAAGLAELHLEVGGLGQPRAADGDLHMPLGQPKGELHQRMDLGVVHALLGAAVLGVDVELQHAGQVAGALDVDGDVAVLRAVLGGGKLHHGGLGLLVVDDVQGERGVAVVHLRVFLGGEAQERPAVALAVAVVFRGDLDVFFRLPRLEGQHHVGALQPVVEGLGLAGQVRRDQGRVPARHGFLVVGQARGQLLGLGQRQFPFRQHHLGAFLVGSVPGLLFGGGGLRFRGHFLIQQGLGERGGLLLQRRPLLVGHVLHVLGGAVDHGVGVVVFHHRVSVFRHNVQHGLGAVPVLHSALEQPAAVERDGVVLAIGRGLAHHGQPHLGLGISRAVADDLQEIAVARVFGDVSPRRGEIKHPVRHQGQVDLVLRQSLRLRRRERLYRQGAE